METKNTLPKINNKDENQILLHHKFKYLKVNCQNFKQGIALKYVCMNTKSEHCLKYSWPALDKKEILSSSWFVYK